MKNAIEQLDRLCDNKQIGRTMKWSGKEAGTYEDTWRNFLNLTYKGKRIINLQKGNIGELGGGVTTMDIGLNPAFRVANILEAKKGSGDLDYVGSRGPESVTKMYSEMLNTYIGEDIFNGEDVIRTGGGTESITLLLEYFSFKKIFQCGAGYFMQYGNGNNIKTILNKEISEKNKGDFRTLPTTKEIKTEVAKDGVIWLIEPSISGESYTKEEAMEIIEIAKEKNAFLVVDGAFKGTEIAGKDTSNFLKTSLKENFMSKTIFFGSPSKGQGFPGKRLGLLASKNKDIMNTIIETAGKRRDGQALNVETNSMWTFLEIFDLEMKQNPTNSVEQNIKNILLKFTGEKDIFLEVKEIITPELINEYLKWKGKFTKIGVDSLDKFQENTSTGNVFSGISGEIKSLFNIFLKVNEDASKEIMKKYDINEFLRLMFLYNGILIAPGQNFGGNKEFWSKSPLILRGTLTSSKEKTQNAIDKVKAGINFLIG